MSNTWTLGMPGCVLFIELKLSLPQTLQSRKLTNDNKAREERVANKAFTKVEFAHTMLHDS